MTRIDRRHPRYGSLKTRAELARALRRGTVVPEGLIAHGRGEAFDYFLGERTTPSARRAERAAARWVQYARSPALSVNGNVAALATPQIVALVRACPKLAVEVNLFHRTPRRAAAIARSLRIAGVPRVLGTRVVRGIPGLPSDRSWVDPRGILRADVVIVPLEDGDRAEALRRVGKTVVSIDLNPLSRTSRVADLPIVDDVRRALQNLAQDLAALPLLPGRRRTPPRFDAGAALRAARRVMAANLTRAASGRASPRPPRGSGRRRRRTP